MTIIENTKTEFINWLNKAESLQSEGYDAAIAKVREAAKILPRTNMTLHHYSFRWGFSFSYGEVEGFDHFIPISRIDRVILRHQLTHDPQGCSWPIRTKEGELFFVPQVTFNETHSESDFAEDTIRELFRSRSEQNRKIIEALHPYKRKIKAADEELYQQILAKYRIFAIKDEVFQ